jgi:hypothetical protein
MPKNENPGGHRGKNKKTIGKVIPLYPAELPEVKQQCFSCKYFRTVEGVRWKRAFCAFTGESLNENWSCPFWEAAEGGEV